MGKTSPDDVFFRGMLDALDNATPLDWRESTQNDTICFLNGIPVQIRSGCTEDGPWATLIIYPDDRDKAVTVESKGRDLIARAQALHSSVQERMRKETIQAVLKERTI